MSKLSALKRAALRRQREDDECTKVGSELAVAMIERSVPKSILDRLGRAGPYGVILLVPRQEHAGMVSDALDDMYEERCKVFALSPTYPLANPREPAEALRRGKATVVVAPSLNLVSDAFRHLADATVRIAPHDQADLRRALRSLLGSRIPKFPPGFVVHPDPDQIVGCIMLDLPVAKIVSALDRLGRSSGVNTDERLPDLEDAIEFGEAQRWGLQVASDVAAWRAGLLDEHDLDTACLMVGPPGYGKTYFARVLARSMSAPLFEITVGTIFQGEGHLADVLQALRRQFEAAASAAPSVLLIDELDSFSRRDVKDNNQSFVTSVINELLTLLDGASSRRPGLVVLGATNLPDAIEPALLRPGRISRRIQMKLPSAAGREHVMRFHLREELVGQSIEEAVRLSSGFTPARLMETTRRARQEARTAGRSMTPGDLERAILGDGGDQDVALLRTVAVHEAGHALAALLLPEAPILRSISLLPEGRTFGLVRTWERDGPNTLSRCEARVTMLLAGRAAELLVLGDDISDGAGSDLQLATDTIVDMHGRLGMYGDIVHHEHPKRLLASDPVFAGRVSAVLLRLMAKAQDLLMDHRGAIVALSEELMSRRLLTAAEAAAIVESDAADGRSDTRPAVAAP